MKIERSILQIDGMTCAQCERSIESALKAVPGVISARVVLRGGEARVEFDAELTDLDAIRAAIEGAGYSVRTKRHKASILALGLGAALAGAYLVANAAGLFNGLPAIDSSLGYGMLFVVGLLTSVHCVAMCGGIALSQSVRIEAAISTEDTQLAPVGRGSTKPSFLERLSPGLLYNAGRLVSYSLVGAVAGAFGAAFGFSPLAKGLIAGAAGFFMLFLGLKMLGLVPSFPRHFRVLPPTLRSYFDSVARALKGRGPFAVGLLNGLMPCGPLQSMQVYALGAGSLLAGAFSMFVFAAGTIPLMLVFGLVAASLPRTFLPSMVRASAVLVLLLGVMTLTRASALAGLSLPGLSSGLPSIPGASSYGPAIKPTAKRAAIPASLLRATLEGGIQTVTTEFGPGQYVPFAVQVGVPVKWTIRIAADDINGCNNPIIIPSLNLQRELVPGDNVIEFTPSKVGTIAYSCWMGMIRSRITVVESLAAVDSGAVAPRAEALRIPGPSAAGLGSCCSGGVDPAFAEGRVPVETLGLPVISDGIQRITVRVDGRGYSPAAIVLQKGMKAIISFDPVELNACNASVVFPEYSGGLDFAKGELSTPAIPVSGDFTFQCWMGMLNGYVRVVDDLAKADLAKIRNEISAYRASGGGGCCASGGLSGLGIDSSAGLYSTAATKL